MDHEGETDVENGTEPGTHDESLDETRESRDAGELDDTDGDVDQETTHEALEELEGADLTATEEAALRRVRAVSWLLDDAIRIPGTSYKIGLDPILGIAPVGGDAVAAALSLYPIAESYRLGASRGMLAKMLVLVGIDAVVGSIPVLGGVFDAFWKANVWNARSLERYLGVS